METAADSALATLAEQYGLSPEDVAAAIEADPELAAYSADVARSFYSFTPRPDRPELFDQQAGYVNAADTVSFFIAGNGSGKTEASAYKCAQFILNKQPPPRPDTPFWIVTETMHIAGEVLWKEKLKGHGHIPACEIDWNRISWDDKKADHPKTVPLLPWPEDRGGDPQCNWQIEFKSFEMGRTALQAASIGGFWFSEQFPADLFTESLVRCRDYLYPGGQFAEFTPLNPDLCVWLEDLLDKEPPNWGFYRGNTEENRQNLATGAIETFLTTVPDELIETRLRGALATFEGAIYPGFSVPVHVVADDVLLPGKIPVGCWHAMGTDWGSSVEHPHATVWGCIDGMGNWYIYDEYFDCQQTKTTFDRAQETVAKCAYWRWPVTRGTVHGMEILKLATGDPHFGMNFADPSRPGEINSFSMYGVPSLPAVNRFYDGVNHVRSLLKVQPNTGKPRLFIAKRCKHLIEELRKYRWRKSRKPTEGTFLNPAAASPQPLKRDDDTADACRYLLASYDRGRTGTTAEASAPSGTPQRKSIQLAGTREVSAPSRGLAGVMPHGKRS